MSSFACKRQVKICVNFLRYLLIMTKCHDFGCHDFACHENIKILRKIFSRNFFENFFLKEFCNQLFLKWYWPGVIRLLNHGINVFTFVIHNELYYVQIYIILMWPASNRINYFLNSVGYIHDLPHNENKDSRHVCPVVQSCTMLFEFEQASFLLNLTKSYPHWYLSHSK